MESSVTAAVAIQPKATLSKNRWRGTLALLLILLPALAAYLIVYSQAFFLPYQDDFGAIIDFAVTYHEAYSWKTKILLAIVHEHTEYKLIFEHLLIIAQLKIVGMLNFKLLIAMGNFSLIPIGGLLWRIYRKEDKRSKYILLGFLPISLLFFSLSYWETLDWATAGIQNLLVVLFALLSLKLLTPLDPQQHRRKRFWCSCLFAWLAGFSLANGFLLAPIGFLMLLRRKAYVACVAWCASFAIAAGIYAYHYHSVHENPPTVLTRGVYFFCFLGCALQNRIAAFITGILLTAIFALSIRRRFEQTHPVTFYFTAWIFCSGAVVAWVRGSTSSRYSIYSVLLLIFAYRFLSGYLLQRFSRLRFPHVLVPALALSTALCVSSDVSAFRNLKQRREMVLAGMNIYLESHGTRSPMVDPLVKITWPKEEEFERVILNRAIQDGVLSRPNIAVK